MNTLHVTHHFEGVTREYYGTTRTVVDRNGITSTFRIVGGKVVQETNGVNTEHFGLTNAVDMSVVFDINNSPVFFWKTIDGELFIRHVFVSTTAQTVPIYPFNLYGNVIYVDEYEIYHSTCSKYHFIRPKLDKAGFVTKSLGKGESPRSTFSYWFNLSGVIIAYTKGAHIKYRCSNDNYLTEYDLNPKIVLKCGQYLGFVFSSLYRVGFAIDDGLVTKHECPVTVVEPSVIEPVQFTNNPLESLRLGVIAVSSSMTNITDNYENTTTEALHLKVTAVTGNNTRVSTVLYASSFYPLYEWDSLQSGLNLVGIRSLSQPNTIESIESSLGLTGTTTVSFRYLNSIIEPENITSDMQLLGISSISYRYLVSSMDAENITSGLQLIGSSSVSYRYLAISIPPENITSGLQLIEVIKNG